MSDAYDVIVVGAGPAGATAAFFLCEAGRRVLVLEKEALPRYKTCGGGLSAMVLDQFPFSFEPVIESRVKEISYVFRDQGVTLPLPDGSMCTVMRDRFDAYILQHTKAEVHERSTVQRIEEKGDGIIVECTDGRRFECSYLIGADGASSVVARCLGLRRDKAFAAAIELEVPVSPTVFAQFMDKTVLIFGEVHIGYLWIFPKSDHLSVGIGALHPKPGELQSALKRVMAHFGISLDGIPIHGHPLPIYLRQEQIATARVLLVGDAAGLVDPCTGEGIRFAIKSGRLAADAILSGHPESYASLVDRQIGRKHRFAASLMNLFYGIPKVFFQLGAYNPFVTRALMDMLDDRIGYGSVLLRMIGTLPLFLLTEVIAELSRMIGKPELAAKLRKTVYPI